MGSDGFRVSDGTDFDGAVVRIGRIETMTVGCCGRNPAQQFRFDMRIRLADN
jgi:hypothetical protein